MSRTSSSGLRKIAALATTVVAAAGLSVVAAPAQAASGQVNYTCAVTSPIPIGGLPFTATADTNAPASIQYGKSTTPTLTAKINIDSATTDLLRDLAGAEQVEGTGTLEAIVRGKTTTRPATITKTAAPASGPMTVPAKAKLAKITGTKLGNVVIAVKNFTADLKLTKKDGTPAGISDVSIECVQDADQVNKVDTIKVVQASTKTTTKLAYASSTKTITATATVTPKVTGKVTFTVTKNSKKFKTVTVKVNAKSQAVARFANLAKGTYKVTAKYNGSTNYKSSTAAAVSKKV